MRKRPWRKGPLFVLADAFMWAFICFFGSLLVCTHHTMNWEQWADAASRALQASNYVAVASMALDVLLSPPAPPT